MEAYNEHAYLEMNIHQIITRLDSLEKITEKLDEIALILLPKGFKKEIEATKRIETKEKTDKKTGNKKHINATCCSSCGVIVGRDDMFCRNCGATFIGFSVGKASDNED